MLFRTLTNSDFVRIRCAGDKAIAFVGGDGGEERHGTGDRAALQGGQPGLQVSRAQVRHDALGDSHEGASGTFTTLPDRSALDFYRRSIKELHLQDR